MTRINVALIGSGNIGTDLMVKALRSPHLAPVWMVGIDPASDGLERARAAGLKTTAAGLDGLLPHLAADQIRIAFDATSAYVHHEHARRLKEPGVAVIDLTPAAVGPYCVPPVNLTEHAGRGEMNVNMVSCGGQATIPMVAAVARVTDVAYAEIVATIASKSAGPGTRANIDEFTETTSKAIVDVGGARRGKAIIILNPAEPPMIMRDTVFCLVGEADRDRIAASITAMADDVAKYVPGYRLKQEVQFTPIHPDEPLDTLVPGGGERPVTRVSVFLEVEGAAHYLPAYAGNLDIMTSAALRVAERVAAAQSTAPAPAGVTR